MIYTILVLLLSIICCCQATTYTFGKNCSVDLERIHYHADIFVKYDGEQLHETCNDMSFSGFDEDNPGDEYRVCVTPEYYEDPDCAVTVIYRNSYRGSPLKVYMQITEHLNQVEQAYGTYNSPLYTICHTEKLTTVGLPFLEEGYITCLQTHPKHTYNCDSKPNSRYCGKGKDSLFIDLKLLAVMTRDVRFKLQVEAELTFNYNSFVAAVVGGVIGGFVFICIVTGVIIFMTCKRKRSPGQVLTPVNRTEREVL